jgi:hypothetical protein
VQGTFYRNLELLTHFSIFAEVRTNPNIFAYIFNLASSSYLTDRFCWTVLFVFLKVYISACFKLSKICCHYSNSANLLPPHPKVQLEQGCHRLY